MTLSVNFAVTIIGSFMYILMFFGATGLVNQVPLRESVWKAAESQVLGTTASNVGPEISQPSTWPLLGLFGLMLGAPYILYRVLAPQINSKTPEGL